MPITVATLAVTPYQVGSVNVPNSQAAPPLLAYTGPVKHRGVHTIYTLANSRINLNINPPNANNALARLSGAQSATGNAVYLKYFDEEITSVRLPYPAPAGLVFFTDNMSGCKFYVDSINGSNDLIVYHANTHQHNPGQFADADVQTANAGTVLDNLHTAAQADYAPLILNNAASCAKPAYNQSAGIEQRRKWLQGRRNTSRNAGAQNRPDFVGGSFIVGFPVGGTWEFWFQTWGDISYERPDINIAKAFVTFHWNYLAKRKKEGLTHRVSYRTMKVMDYNNIY